MTPAVRKIVEETIKAIRAEQNSEREKANPDQRGIAENKKVIVKLSLEIIQDNFDQAERKNG